MTKGPDEALSAATEQFEYFLGECQRLARVYCSVYELFVKEQETSVPLLHKLAPGLFSEMYVVYRERLHLGIARLTDPPRTPEFAGTGKRNLSAHGVVAALQDAGLPAAAEAHLADQLRRFRESERLEFLRNKHIAHLDAEVILNGQGLPIPTFDALNEFFELLQQFVETASESLGFQVTSPVFYVIQKGYGERLLNWLDVLDFENVPEDAIRHMYRDTLPPCVRSIRKIGLPPEGQLKKGTRAQDRRTARDNKRFDDD